MQGDEWDWPYILYIGRIWLRYTDNETWNLTPRQFKAQLNVHIDVQQKMNGGGDASTQAPTGYIDQLKGW